MKLFKGKILIDVSVEETTKSGIVIAEADQKRRKSQGRVVQSTSDQVEEGQEVLFSQYGPVDLELDGRHHVVAEEEHLIAIL